MRFSVGRTFADKDRPTRWYVYLPVDGCFCLVWWENGRPRTIDHAKVRLDPRDFCVGQLLMAWGIKHADLDAFLERRWYRWEADVKTVRATRRETNGRTIDHVRHRHRVGRVRGT